MSARRHNKFSLRRYRQIFATIDGMNPLSGRLMSVVLIGCCIAGLSVPGHTIGVSVQRSDDAYRFFAGSSVFSLCVSIGVLLIYVARLRSAPLPSGPPLEGLIRRFFAFHLDLYVVMSIAAPLGGLPPVIAEWRSTGVFAWWIYREYQLAFDFAWAIAGVLFTFAMLFFYFAVTIYLGRPTLGACALGYQVIPVDGREMSLRAACKRTGYSIIAIPLAIVTSFGKRNRTKGQMWLDRTFNTQAVRIG